MFGLMRNSFGNSLDHIICESDVKPVLKSLQTFKL